MSQELVSDGAVVAGDALPVFGPCVGLASDACAEGPVCVKLAVCLAVAVRNRRSRRMARLILTWDGIDYNLQSCKANLRIIGYFAGNRIVYEQMVFIGFCCGIGNGGMCGG